MVQWLTDHAPSPVVRVAPNRLVFSSTAAIQGNKAQYHISSSLLTALDIYNNPRVTKGRAYIQLRQDIHGPPNLLNTLEKDLRRQKRRVIAPVVSDRSMRIFEPDMLKQVDNFLTQLLRSSQHKQTVNMSPRCERLGVDVVGQLAFGYALNTQAGPLHRAVVASIKARGARVSLYFFWSRLRSLEWLLNRLRGGKEHFEGIHASLKTMIGARMMMPKDARHDLYKMASKDSEHGEGFISKDLWAEAVFFIAAGMLGDHPLTRNSSESP